MKDAAGGLVCSDNRAETLAAYLETVQWRVRPASVVDSPPLGNELPVPLGNFSADEIMKVLRKLRRGKSPDLQNVQHHSDTFRSFLDVDFGVFPWIPHRNRKKHSKNIF